VDGETDLAPQPHVVTGSNGTAGAKPSLGAITLVVPVRDEERSLAALLDAIAAQTRPPDWVILVDAGSTDDTLALARRLTAGDDRYTLLSVGPATPGRARNIGIAAAWTDWVALTDAGIRPARDWLMKLEAAALNRSQCDVAYGTYEPTVDSLFAECAALAYVAPRRSTPAGELRGPFIASSLVRRSAWAAVGGFPDLRAGEDTIFMQRLERSGAATAWAPDAVVVWSTQPDLRRTFRRFRLYARVGALAGRQNNWHYGVARIYLGVAAILVTARVLDRRIAALLPVAGLARVTTGIERRREGRSPRWAFAPQRLGGVALILVTTDAALFVGWSEAVMSAAGLRRAAPEASRVGPD
jgi:cellulose synthase/poly-beta-1,6-N-acetylglucosamine synthase-like glycosyltransferase